MQQVVAHQLPSLKPARLGGGALASMITDGRHPSNCVIVVSIFFSIILIHPYIYTHIPYNPIYIYAYMYPYIHIYIYVTHI